jgi:hypothetical protein
MEVQGIYRELLERMGSLPAPGTTTATPLGARHPAFSTS